VRFSKTTDDLKMADVVLQTLDFEAFRDLTATPNATLSATITDSQYLPF
jgi:hypothetical protein